MTNIFSNGLKPPTRNDLKIGEPLFDCQLLPLQRKVFMYGAACARRSLFANGALGQLVGKTLGSELGGEYCDELSYNDTPSKFEF